MDNVRYNYFNTELLKPVHFKYYEPNCYNIYLKYVNNKHTHDFFIETPWMNFSIDKTIFSNESKKTYVNLHFNNDKNIKIIQFYNILKKIDNYTRYNNGFINYFDDIDIDIKTKKFVHSLKHYTIPHTINNSRLKVKVTPKLTRIYNNPDNKTIKDIDNEEYIIKATLQCHSVWISDTNYGLTWIAKSINFKKKNNIYKDALFS